ncbi:GNAT family N-acetyltransferase [Saccharopolyspora sp. 6M]|uniref:GNAT family N-acetyltransferase n=1 Tax=Saccharopolyspora sp. 6M TaxID=2877237 RepID=UPI0027E087CE|nr:GNAT family N-acetyltransferase [Saccharopolyspora sp. 6M]
MLIRVAEAADLAALPEVERRSGACFREVGMDRVALDPPMPVRVLEGFRDRGALWVAVEVAGPVAFLAAERLDGTLHVAQVSVDPRCARRRIGAALLAHAGARVVRFGCAALTLTTFRLVPWNAPYYARLGFREVPPAVMSPGLAARHAAEQAVFPHWPRMAMCRAG